MALRMVSSLQDSEKDYPSFYEIMQKWNETVQYNSNNTDGINCPQHIDQPDLTNIPFIIRECAYFAQTKFNISPMYIITLMLAAMNCAVRGFYRVDNGIFKSVINAFFIFCASSGYGKSPINNFLVRPHLDFQNEINEEIEKQKKDNEIEAKICTNRINHLYKVSRKITNQSKLEEMKHEIKALEIKLESLNKVKLSLFTDDFTIPGIIKLLSEQDERIAVMTSEAGFLRTLKSADGSSNNLDKMLRLFNGDPIDQTRKKEPPINLVNPIISPCVAAQPSILSETFRNNVIVSSGLRSRCLICIADERNIGNRHYSDIAFPDYAYRSYENTIKHVLSTVREKKSQYKIMRLDKRAKERFNLFISNIEISIREGGFLYDIRDWGAKASYHISTIAGLIQLYENQDENCDIITSKTFETAENFFYWLAENMRSFNNYTFPHNSQDIAYIIAQRIIDKKIMQFQQRDIQRMLPNINRADIIIALDTLIYANAISKILMPQKNGPGRPESQYYSVNFFHIHHVIQKNYFTNMK